MSVRNVPAADTVFLLRTEGDGDGPPVLLLHGVPETSCCWRDVAPRLADGRRVLAPDLPGLGGSSYAGPYDVGSLVRQLAALVEAEVPGGRVDVVGHDWGGILALGLAQDRPDLVRRLGVANAPFRTPPPFYRAAYVGFFALPVAPELLFKVAGRQTVEAMLAAGWKSAPGLDPQVRAEYIAAYADPRPMLAYYRAAVRGRLTGHRGRTPVRAERMLVLWGALDPVLPVSTGEAVVRDLGPTCEMVTVPGAGHFVIEEAGEVVVEQLIRLLRDDAPGS